MSIIQKIFAYNTGSTIAGTIQVGDIAISQDDIEYSANYGGLQWWGGPDETNGYVIAIPVPAGDADTPVGIDAYLRFKRSEDLTNNSFIDLVNSFVSTPPAPFTSATDASTWLTSNGYWNSYGNLPSFTITSSDFTNGGPIYQDTLAVGTNGVDGFINTASQVNFYEGYYGYGLTPSAISLISAAITQAGLDPNNSTGYIWSVTWGSGSSISSGYVKFGFDAGGGYFDMQTVDPADTDWQLPGVGNGTTLAGTFLFPATFTQYSPLTNKGGWC